MSRSALYEQEIARLRKKRIAAIGLGVSNMSVIAFLTAAGCSVTALDRKPAEELAKEVVWLEQLGVSYRLGESYLDGLERYDEIFVSPGVPIHIPQIVEAVKAGATLNGEIKLFLRLCGRQVVGITGSAGKTTTTSLLHAMIKGSGKDCIVAGNIGAEVLSRMEYIADDTVVVLELSSFQLQIVDTSPHIGAILNLSQNHLDHHLSLDEYYQAKENIIRFQSSEDFAVLNADNAGTLELARSCMGTPKLYSLKPISSDGAYLDGDSLVYRSEQVEERVCTKSDINLLGEHNLCNCLAAILMGRICEVSAESIRNTIRLFRGVEHRLEQVCCWNGIVFYNDSIATSPDRTIAAMRAIDRPIVLIAGGRDKNLDYDELGSAIVSKARALVLVGAASDRIHRSVEKALAERGQSSREEANLEGVALEEVRRAAGFREAVETAVSLAGTGDAVLLSPACASFDLFRSYKHRGDAFKQIVRELTADRP